MKIDFNFSVNFDFGKKTEKKIEESPVRKTPNGLFIQFPPNMMNGSIPSSHNRKNVLPQCQICPDGGDLAREGQKIVCTRCGLPAGEISDEQE